MKFFCLISLFMLPGLIIVNSNAQGVETEKDTINHQQRILSSDTTELQQKLSSVGMVDFFLQRFESKQRDYIRFRKFFVRRAKINKKYSNLSLTARLILQLGGGFIAAYAQSKEDTDIHWIVWGISGGIPLTLQSIETFLCKWKDKSTLYHESSKRTGSLIRRVEQEIYLLKISPPDDSLRMLDSLKAFMATWDTIRSTSPAPVDESDVEGIEDPTLFMKPPSIF